LLLQLLPETARALLLALLPWLLSLHLLDC
jgi:hypothetical protein